MSVKSWFRKIKLKFIWKFAENWIAEILDRFKAKRPRIFVGVVVPIAGVLHFGLQKVIRIPLEQAIGVEEAAELLQSLPEAFLSLGWIFAQINWTGSTAEAVATALTWIFTAIIGTSTAPYLVNTTRQEKRIAKSKEISKQQQAKKAAA